MATKIIIIVASAFISGLKPNLILEKIKIGNVVDPGPVTKLAITKSSSDRQNAKSHPDRSPGAVDGGYEWINPDNRQNRRGIFGDNVSRFKSFVGLDD